MSTRSRMGRGRGGPARGAVRAMSLDRFISAALDPQPAGIPYLGSQRLAELYPEQAVIEGADPDFKLLDYVREGFCTLRRKDAVHGQLSVWWKAAQGVCDA